MANARRGRNYRVAQKQVETKQAIEDAYVGSNVVDIKHAAIAFAAFMLVFVNGIIIGHRLGKHD